MAIDFAGPAIGLSDFEHDELRGNPVWETSKYDDAQQGSFVDWQTDHAKGLEHISRMLCLSDGDSQTLRVMSSRSPEALNNFLGINNLPAAFRNPSRSDETAIGLASITTLAPKWQGEVQPFVLRARDDEPFRGFVIEHGVEFYTTMLMHGGLKDPLIRVRTQDGGSLWLMATRRPESEVDLAIRATAILRATHKLERCYGSSVALPELVVSLRPNLSWLHGLKTVNGNKEDVIKTTYQQIDLSIIPNKQTNGTPTHTQATDVFALNEPFMGFFTLPDSSVPICTFFTDPGGWQAPNEPIPA